MVKVLHADAVIPGDGAPLLDAAVVVGDNGEIVDVGPAASVLPAHAGATLERVRGVLFPALVNAHTHVELCAMRGKVPGGRGFVEWVEGLVAIRPEVRPEEDHEAIGRGVDELVAAGTAAVGDVTNSLAAVLPLARAGIEGAIFHEAFGLRDEVVLPKVRAMEEERRAVVGDTMPPGLAYAPAPHTLYTTHHAAVRELLARARAMGARSTLHLAEHMPERRAIEGGDGPVADWYRRRPQIGWMDWPKKPLFDVAQELGAIGPDVLLVHLTDARPDELARVAKAGSPVVLCPRSNLHIELRLPPLLAVRDAGIEAALGTDSLASNASLDVLAEARALQDRFPAVPARELVQMATWNGARVLGRPDLGRIVKGARPGLIAVDTHPGADPCAALLKQVKAPRRWLDRRGFA